MYNIRKVVENMVSKYKTNDPFKLAETLEFKVIEFDFLPRTKGLVVMLNGHIIIGINKNLTGKEKRDTLAHEIGHAILHLGKQALKARKNWNGKRSFLRRGCWEGNINVSNEPLFVNS